MLGGLNKSLGARSSSQPVLLLPWSPGEIAVLLHNIPQHEKQAWKSGVRINYSVSSSALNKLTNQMCLLLYRKSFRNPHKPEVLN